MNYLTFAEYVAWREGRFFTAPPIKSSIAPNAIIDPKPTKPKTGELKPVKLPKPKVVKVPPVKLPVLKVGQRLGVKAKYPH
jgi:hypothetical protein